MLYVVVCQCQMNRLIQELPLEDTPANKLTFRKLLIFTPQNQLFGRKMLKRGDWKEVDLNNKQITPGVEIQKSRNENFAQEIKLSF